MGKEDQGGNPHVRKPPAHVVDMGSVRGSIWENEGKKGTWYTITLNRRYRDGAGAIKYSATFGPEDALIAAEVLRTCYVWIATKEGPVIVEEDGSRTASE